MGLGAVKEPAYLKRTNAPSRYRKALMVNKAKCAGPAKPAQRPWHLLLLLLPLAALLGSCGMMQHRGMMAPVEPRPVVTPAPTATPGGQAAVSFSRDVRPLLTTKCAGCHGGVVGLYVDSYDTLLAGSTANKVVAPGDPSESILVRRLTGELQPRMPLGAPFLSEREIAIVVEWIREGAPNN